MTVIYIDQYFAVNLAADYLLLLCTARICAIYIRRSRIFLCALAGAAYAAAAVAFRADVLALIPVKLLAGGFMCAGAFGLQRRTIRAAAVYFLCAFLFAGFLVGLRCLFAGGPGRLDALALCMCLMGAAALTVRILARRARAAAGGVYRVDVALGTRHAVFDAFLDTGNALQDPMTGQHVLVAELDCIAPLLPPGTAAALRREDGAAARLEAAAALAPAAGFRLIPLRTVSGRSMLVAFRPDQLLIDGRNMQGVLIAVSAGKLSDGGGYTALAGDWISFCGRKKTWT